MKKLLIFLCVVFLVLGVVGCNEESRDSKYSSYIASSNNPLDEGGNSDIASVPELATILLFGSGLVGLGMAGRKKFFKKDQGKG